MKRIAVISLFLLMVQSPLLDARTQSAPKPAAPNAAALADQWFVRLNELDDWYISVDGKEENNAVVDRFMELYRPDAYHQIGPSEKQLGQVVLHGSESIRKWTSDFSKNYVNVNYRIEHKTQNEKTAEPFYLTQFQWGGIGVAVEFMATWRNREDRRQWAMPGAAFFIFDEAGKVQNLRLYLLRDELFEINP